MKVHDFNEDVENPDNQKAEKVVLEILNQHYPKYSVEDVSAQRLKWDFVITSGNFVTRIDAKFDANMGRTNRLPLELYDEYPSGAVRPTWGVNPGLDYVAVVPWTFTEVVFVPIPSLIRYVVFKLVTRGEEYLIESEDWKHWSSHNIRGGYKTHGLAIPRDRFEAFIETYPDEDPLLVYPTARVHYRDKPRLLVGGKEVA